MDDPAAPATADAALDRFRAMLELRTGLIFPGPRRAVLSGRLKECAAALGGATMDELFEKARSAPLDSPVWTTLVNALVTDETSWFRYPEQYETLGRFLLPALASQRSFGDERRIRILSAGCSRGHEAYSTAMLLLENPEPWRGLEPEITAVDICPASLAHAERAEYQGQELRGLDPERLERWFAPAGGGLHGVKPDVKSMVRFARHNLLDPPPAGPWDIVFCRNVTIYFGRDVARGVISRLASSLRDGGHLFAGHAESYNGWVDTLKPVQMGRALIYRKPHPPRSPSRDSESGAAHRPDTSQGTRP